MTNNYSNYINKCFDNVGITPASVDMVFETEKIAYFLFSDCKSEIYLNPKKDNKCLVSMWLANKYYNGNDKTSGQTNIKTTDIGEAMEIIRQFIEAKTGEAVTVKKAV
jgi:hypothetical protein